MTDSWLRGAGSLKGVTTSHKATVRGLLLAAGCKLALKPRGGFLAGTLLPAEVLAGD
jgi:hypothetical protein